MVWVFVVRGQRRGRHIAKIGNTLGLGKALQVDPIKPTLKLESAWS
jgi:hypothetical protein